MRQAPPLLLRIRQADFALHVTDRGWPGREGESGDGSAHMEGVQAMTNLLPRKWSNESDAPLHHSSPARRLRMVPLSRLHGGRMHECVRENERSRFIRTTAGGTCRSSAAVVRRTIFWIAGAGAAVLGAGARRAIAQFRARLLSAGRRCRTRLRDDDHRRDGRDQNGIMLSHDVPPCSCRLFCFPGVGLAVRTPFGGTELSRLGGGGG